MENSVAGVAQSNILPDVMLASGATDEVMNLQAPAAIGLGPPADSAAAVEFNPGK